MDSSSALWPVTWYGCPSSTLCRLNMAALLRSTRLLKLSPSPLLRVKTSSHGPPINRLYSRAVGGRGTEACSRQIVLRSLGTSRYVSMPGSHACLGARSCHWAFGQYRDWRRNHLAWQCGPFKTWCSLRIWFKNRIQWLVMKELRLSLTCMLQWLRYNSFSFFLIMWCIISQIAAHVELTPGLCRIVLTWMWINVFYLLRSALLGATGIIPRPNFSRRSILCKTEFRKKWGMSLNCPLRTSHHSFQHFADCKQNVRGSDFHSVLWEPCLNSMTSFCIQ